MDRISRAVTDMVALKRGRLSGKAAKKVLDDANLLSMIVGCVVSGPTTLDAGRHLCSMACVSKSFLNSVRDLRRSLEASIYNHVQIECEMLPDHAFSCIRTAIFISPCWAFYWLAGTPQTNHKYQMDVLTKVLGRIGDAFSERLSTYRETDDYVQGHVCELSIMMDKDKLRAAPYEKYLRNMVTFQSLVNDPAYLRSLTAVLRKTEKSVRIQKLSRMGFHSAERHSIIKSSGR